MDTQYKKSKKTLHQLISEGYEVKSTHRYSPDQSTSGNFMSAWFLSCAGPISRAF